MHGTMSMEVLEQRRAEMLCEAQRNRLKKALRADLKRPAIHQRASTVVWGSARVASLLRKFSRTPQSAG